jgi:acyl-CoA thioester hydrolase
MASFAHAIRIRYVECDMQGHVFNGQYLTYLDVAHTELLRAAIDGGYQRLLDEGLDFVVAEASIRFRAPATFDEVLDIAVEPQPTGRTSLTTRFTLRVGERLVAEAELRHVCVDSEHHQPTPWPDWLGESLAPYGPGG